MFAKVTIDDHVAAIPRVAVVIYTTWTMTKECRFRIVLELLQYSPRLEQWNAMLFIPSM
jgi:hypothetical protein